MAEAARVKFRPEELLALAGPSGDPNVKRVLQFLLSGAPRKAIDQVFLACGRTADALAAVLSQRLTREEGEHLAGWFTDPAAEKLATVLPAMSGRRDPPELKESGLAAAERARLEIIRSCEEVGIAPATCQAFPRMQMR